MITLGHFPKVPLLTQQKIAQKKERFKYAVFIELFGIGILVLVVYGLDYLIF